MKDNFDFKEIPRNEWPMVRDRQVRLGLYKSKTFLVQVVQEENDVIRLTINRTEYNHKKDRWEEGISWDSLQEIKNFFFPDRDAVEVFPQALDVVNVANMRHLWVQPDALPFAWRKGTPKPAPKEAGRAVFICKGCEGIYAEPVSRCDCGVEGEFLEGYIVLNKGEKQ